MPEIVEYSERCVFCRKRKATLLCDFIKGSIWTSIDFKRTPQTCDNPMCEKCAIEMSEDYHFCPKCLDVVKQKIKEKLTK